MITRCAFLAIVDVENGRCVELIEIGVKIYHLFYGCNQHFQVSTTVYMISGIRKFFFLPLSLLVTFLRFRLILQFLLYIAEFPVSFIHLTTMAFLDLNVFENHPSLATITAFSTFVSVFNRLPRPHPDLYRLDFNHWHFSLRNIDIGPPHTMLFLVSPAGRETHFEISPTRYLANAPLQVKAYVSAILLLRAFAGEALGRLRPWSWSTDSLDMACLVSIAMRKFGVRDGLETVAVTSPRTMKIADEEWLKFYTAILEVKLAQEREKLVWL